MSSQRYRCIEFLVFYILYANILVFLTLDRDAGTCTGNKCLIDMACFAGGVGLGWLIQFGLLARLRDQFVLVPVVGGIPANKCRLLLTADNNECVIL